MREDNTDFLYTVNLPGPNLHIETAEVDFYVYRAKDLYKKEWNNQFFKKLVEESRKSYNRYGTRDLLDEVDQKACIYLVCSKYGPGKNTIEWLSVRMVPGDGEFYGVGEVEIYVDKQSKRPAIELLTESLGCFQKDMWSLVVSDSRMCGIHPYTEEGNEIKPNSSEKHLYTTENMALMQACFMIDYPSDEITFRYVSSILRAEIKDKVIGKVSSKTTIRPHFVPAEEVLGLPPDSLIVDREVYTYQFPSYWLDMEELRNTISTLLDSGKISHQTLTEYLGTSSLDNLSNNHGLIDLLTADGKIAGSSITGKELREIIDEKVSDKPKLQLTPLNKWRQSYIKILIDCGIDVVKMYPQLKKYLIQ